MVDTYNEVFEAALGYRRTDDLISIRAKIFKNRPVKTKRVQPQQGLAEQTKIRRIYR